MTPRLTHLNDDELAQLADGALSTADLRDIDAHLTACKQCQQAVDEALRGLALLARASEPPSNMAQHASARRWALARDPSSLVPEADGEIAEVGGRGIDENAADTDKLGVNDREKKDSDKNQ